MIKSELVERIAAQNPHLFRQDVQRIVDAIFEEISQTLENGDRAELRGFGTFYVSHRKGRMGRNPKTGEAVKVDEKSVPRYKISKSLTDRMNSKD